EPVPRYEEEETMAAPAEMPASHASGSRRTGMQPMVEVPDHMAGSAAFGDMLGSEPSPTASHFAINTPAAAFETSVIVPAPPVPVTDYEIPASAKEEFTSSSAEESPAFAQEEAEPAVAEPAPPPEAVTTELDAAPEVSVTQVENTLEPAPETVSLKPEPAAEPRHPQFIPVFKEPVAAEPEYAFLPTAAPPVSDVEISREPALQETAEETTRNTKVDLVEPGLMSAIGQQVKAFPADRVEEPAPAEAASSSAAAGSEVSYSAPVPAIEAAPELSDADFEARVAAAMAAYSHGSEPEIPPVTLTEPQPPAIAEARNTPAPYEVRTGGMAEAMPTFQAPVPSFEYQPSARAAAPASAEIEAEHTSVQADAPAPGSSSSDAAKAAVAASMEAAIPEAAAAVAADTGADQHTIAQAVHRVMEKLKPELVEEIMRELKSKK
ncbi:MAG TPA: hypothetical protein VE133_15155, partial [Candidatus Sulfotelmatobacter sp.]|nr:hypothetical protein [Candidatus Sulfotelmatobacter sp.]